MPSLLSHDIADKIQYKITSGEYVVNQKLPSERTMAELYGVSRNVIREALKILSEKGFVEVQSGRGGYVNIPDDKEIAQKLEMTITNSNVSLTEILDVREILETAIIKMSIKVITKKDIATLSRYYDEMQAARKQEKLYAELDAKFHEELSNCCGNSVLAVLTKTFYKVTAEKMFMVATRSPQKIAQAQREHKAIIEGLNENDAQKAVNAVNKHMNCIRNQIECKKV